jgi:hypothetical protein
VPGAGRHAALRHGKRDGEVAGMRDGMRDGEDRGHGAGLAPQLAARQAPRPALKVHAQPPALARPVLHDSSSISIGPASMYMAL